MYEVKIFPLITDSKLFHGIMLANTAILYYTSSKMLVLLLIMFAEIFKLTKTLFKKQQLIHHFIKYG